MEKIGIRPREPSACCASEALGGEEDPYRMAVKSACHLQLAELLTVKHHPLVTKQRPTMRRGW